MTVTEPRRRQVDHSSAQLVRQAEIGDEIRAIARTVHPERFGPDGAPLMGWAGTTWTERLASWYEAHEEPATRAHADEPDAARNARPREADPDVPDDAPANVESGAPENDQPYARVRGES